MYSLSVIILNIISSAVFDTIEDYAPGFKESIVGTDILTPCDLERVFGLTGGVSNMDVSFKTRRIRSIRLHSICIHHHLKRRTRCKLR